MNAAPLVELHDGRRVPSDSHEWKLECLARHLMRLPLDKRRAWLAGFGPANEQALLACMNGIRRAREAGRNAQLPLISDEYLSHVNSESA